VLSEVIVQILAKPAPFTIRYSRDLLVEPASLRYLTLKRGRPLMHPSIKLTNDGS
jgi:hypothetical protein